MSETLEHIGAQRAKHSKTRILSAKRFKPLEKDFLRAILSDDEMYTIDEAAEKLEIYMKQEAK